MRFAYGLGFVSMIMAGCLGASSSSTEQLDVRWTVLQGGGTQAACPAAPYDNVFVVAQGTEVFDFGDKLPLMQVDDDAYILGPFPCSDGGATVELATGEESPCAESQGSSNKCDRSSGAYLISLYFSDPTGAITKKGDTVEKLVGLHDGPGQVDLAFAPTAGFIAMGWTLHAMSDEQALDCASGAVDQVRVTAQLTGKLETDADGNQIEVPASGSPVTATIPCDGFPFNAPQVGPGDCPDEDTSAGGLLAGWIVDPVTNACVESDGYRYFSHVALDPHDFRGGWALGPLEPGYYTVQLDALGSGQVVGGASSGGHLPDDPPGAGEFEARIGGENVALAEEPNLVISTR